MRNPSPRIRVDELSALPEGVTLAEWSLERQRWQNPRIRTLLGSITLISGVLESNYAILHCSPDRLVTIWHRVREVSALLRDELVPLLEAPSIIEPLHDEIQRAKAGLAVLESSVLARLDDEPIDDPSGTLLELRKLLCIALGQIHGYLQETFGRLMAADPRSLHDSDYYLSLRFPRDIEEAEWLHTTVQRLRRYLRNVIEPARREKIEAYAGPLAGRTIHAEQVPWPEVLLALGEVRTVLVPKLKEVLALRGIRFAEMEVLDRYSEELPARCFAVAELHECRVELATLPSAQRAVPELAVRIGRILTDIDETLKDIVSFVPLWIASIEERRALLLRQT